MGGRIDRFLWLVLAWAFGSSAWAQFGSTFAYTGDDALRDASDVHWVHYGGFGNNVLLQDDQLLWPWLPTLFFEQGYLIKPANELANISLSVSPEVFLTAFFMGRVTANAEVVLGNEASNKTLRGLGCRFGVGYSALGSTFGLTESTPVVRAGALFGNIRLTYAYSLGTQTAIDHQIGVGIKFDW